MNRLTSTLLAGTLLPALALLPLACASAETPDQQGHGQRQRPEGAGRPPQQGIRAGNAEPRQGGGGGGGPRRQDVQQGTPRPGGNRGAAADEGRNRPRTQGQNVPRTPETPQPRPKTPVAGGNPADRGNRNDSRRDDRGTPRRADDRPNGTPTKKEQRRNADPGNGTDNARREENRINPRRAGADDRPNGTTAKKERRQNAAPDNGTDNARRDEDRINPRRAGADDRPNGTPTKKEQRRNADRDNGNKDTGNKDNGNNNARRDDDRGSPRRAGDDDRGTPRRADDPSRRPNGVPNAAVRIETPVGPTGIRVGVGLGGGVLPPTGARSLDELRRERREVREGDRTFIREPGRTIVEERGRAFIVHDENDRFRSLGLNIRRERRGNAFVDTINQPGGVVIVTTTDLTGRLLRRTRRTRDGREFVLIDNGDAGHLRRYDEDVVVLAPPPLRIPRDRYVVDYRQADAGLLYDTLIAPPLAAPPRRYTLDQVRYSPAVRDYVRSVDIDTINFDPGSWEVPAAASGQLEALATAIKRALGRNPNSVFLVEGYTDATGNPDDNLTLSDRRAQSVAEILTKDFGVPPENLTTQGYGQQNPKEETQGPSAANRRVVVQNITQLLAAGDQPPAEQ